MNGFPVLEKVPKITRNDDREARSKELEWGELRCLSKGSKCLTSPVPLTPISFAVLIPCSFGTFPKTLDLHLTLEHSLNLEPFIPGQHSLKLWNTPLPCGTFLETGIPFIPGKHSLKLEFQLRMFLNYYTFCAPRWKPFST